MIILDLLYVARDAQMIDEFIRSKLFPSHLVFSGFDNWSCNMGDKKSRSGEPATA